MSTLLALFIAPICGFIIDYRANRGMTNLLLFMIFSLWIFQRLFSKNIKYFYPTNIDMVSDNTTLYCLYVSINSCCSSSDIYFYLLTYNAYIWLSSSYYHTVNTDKNLMLFLISIFDRFPPQFIGTLLGIMWTAAGIVSFVTYGLTRLATNPTHAWRVWITSNRFLSSLFAFCRHGWWFYVCVYRWLVMWFNYGIYISNLERKQIKNYQ
jgi:hypothetical protein